MSSTNIQTQDKEIVKVNIVNNVDMRIVNLTLGKSVDVNAVLKSNNSLVDVKNFHIEGAEYDAWGNNDNYLENLILSKCDLTRK